MANVLDEAGRELIELFNPYPYSNAVLDRPSTGKHATDMFQPFQEGNHMISQGLWDNSQSAIV